MENTKLNLNEVITGLLSKAYKIDSGKIAEIISSEEATTESVLNEFLKADAARVEKLKSAAGEEGTFQQGYAKAKKEVLTERENEIKTKYGVDTDKTGLDLIDTILAEKTAAAAGTNPDENTVKSSAAYLALEKQFKTQLQEKEKEWSEKYTGLETAQKENEIFSAVRENAANLLSSMSPIESKNANVATTIKNQFFAELKNNYKFDKAADGSIIIKDLKGNVQSDAHGHNLTLDSLVKNVSSNYYDFAENNGGKNAGNKDDESGSGAFSGNIPKFKNENEALAYATNEAIPLEARNAALDAWNSQNG